MSNQQRPGGPAKRNDEPDRRSNTKDPPSEVPEQHRGPSTMGRLATNVNRLGLKTGTRPGAIPTGGPSSPSPGKMNPPQSMKERSRGQQCGAHNIAPQQPRNPAPEPEPSIPPSTAQTMLKSLPFEFTQTQKRSARNKSYGVGDIVNYEYISQAPLNLDWEWTNDTHTSWRYTKEDVHYVPSRDHALDPNNKPTIPAVYIQRRWGIFGAVCDNQPFRGPKLMVYPLFTYGRRGLVHPDGKLQDAAYCAEHLALMHEKDAVVIEKQVSAFNCNPVNHTDPRFLDTESDHPYAPWGSMLRGNHYCPRGTFLRLTSASEIHMQDPRMEKHGELDRASKKVFHSVMLKVHEMLSTDPADRRDVDVSKYPWLEHLDRFSSRRRQERADRIIASGQAVSQTQSRKRKLSDVDESSLPPSNPVAGTQSSVSEIQSLLDGLSPEDQRQVFAHLSKRVKLEENVEDGEIEA